MVCLYGPSVLTLPNEQQMILWHARDKARSMKQSIHWDTTGELTKERVGQVYQDLYGEERAMDIRSLFDRKDKEAQALARLYEDK